MITSNPYVGTFTGRKVHFLNPHTDEIHIDDITQSLGMQCRFNGHVKKFYSVAEHSVHVARLVLERTDDKRQALYALLHDASEAYLCDIQRPIKLTLTNYEDIEKRLQDCIFAKYDAPLHSHVTDYIDKHIVRVEAEQLYPVAPDWVEQYDRIDMQVKCWEPIVAQSQFQHMFKVLTDA